MGQPDQSHKRRCSEEQIATIPLDGAGQNYYRQKNKCDGKDGYLLQQELLAAAEFRLTPCVFTIFWNGLSRFFIYDVLTHKICAMLHGGEVHKIGDRIFGVVWVPLYELTEIEIAKIRKMWSAILGCAEIVLASNHPLFITDYDGEPDLVTLLKDYDSFGFNWREYLWPPRSVPPLPSLSQSRIEPPAKSVDRKSHEDFSLKNQKQRDSVYWNI